MIVERAPKSILGYPKKLTGNTKGYGGQHPLTTATPTGTQMASKVIHQRTTFFFLKQGIIINNHTIPLMATNPHSH